jgi:hypothetical protein
MSLNGYIENLKTIETNSSLIKTAFDYRIVNFLTLNNSEIISPTFRVRDTKWLVKVFTSFWKHNIEYIEIALCLNESDRAVNKAKFRISIYIIISLFCLCACVCVCVCVTLYRLGPWTSYRHETGIIRTSMTRRGT